MPVFLSIAPAQPSMAQSGLIRVTFQLKSAVASNAFFARFNISPSRTFSSLGNPLFANTFNAQVPESLLIAMQEDPDVNYVQIDQRVQAFAITTTDPFFTLESTDPDKQWYLPKTKVPDAWDYTKGSASTTVAIIDTGIHATHLELNDGRVVAGYNVLTSQPIPAASNSDDNGHGTSVAGVIGAIPNNSLGIAGTNWSVKLMPVKVLDADGSGEISSVAAGIIWAADHGANIINMSMGGAGFRVNATLSAALTYAFDRGLLIVSAAGNDLAEHGLNLDNSMIYPVCADNGKNMVLGVAATDSFDKKADFSNFGRNCVDISAPGKRIITTAFLPNNPSNNVLIYGSGTSLAAPLVSGIAALLKATNVNLTNVDLQNILMRTADPIDALNETSCLGSNCNGFLGSGRVNALAAVTPKQLAEGSLIRESSTGNIFFFANKTKRLVSEFVMEQRGFDPNSIVNEFNQQLTGVTTGNALTPLEGTLVMMTEHPQVYVIYQEMIRPLTNLVFASRGYKFSDIKILSQAEIATYAPGDWYWPPDGTMVLVSGNPLVFVMDQQVAWPVTYFVFTQRHLSFSNVVTVTADEFTHVPPRPDLYWLPPLDGTLIKSDTNQGIYVIENGTRRLLSFQAFTARGYNFSNVVTLPEAEIQVTASGLPIEQSENNHPALGAGSV